ncbi:MAG: GntR family transcriptional regulator [Wenzhouxiangella sp.]
MHFDLQSESSTPIYRQIVEQLRRQINGGLLRPGDALPSVRQVAEQHTINPMTVSRAYSLLEAEGLLIRRRGKPMAVAAGLATESSARQRLGLLQPRLEQVAREARQLGLSLNEVVTLLVELMDKEET